MPQLDTLRAIAVGAVLFHHLSADAAHMAASLGVKLFFSISGFLITGILLDARHNAEAAASSRFAAVGRFYARRTLRIFPVYYLVVAITYAVDLEPARDIIAWLLTYTLNIHMARQGWYEPNFAHFWTLAVEEQFYLCWPWLVLFVPRTWLVPAILAILAAGPFYRWWYVLSDYSNMSAVSTYIATPTCLDHLGFGALLALAVRRLRAGTIQRVAPVAFAVSVLVATSLTSWVRGPLEIVFFDTATACAFCCLIFWASRRVGGPFGRFMEFRPILYVGRISYGLYLYHPFMGLLALWVLLQFGLESGFAVAALSLALTIGVASVSWHFLEKPINDLKRYF